MTRTRPFIASILALAIGLAAIGVTLQQKARDNPEDLPPPSKCITDSVVELTANPTVVNWGDSTALTWKAVVPIDCPDVQVSLESDPVASTGNRSVIPTRSRAYTLFVSERRGPVFSYKRAIADVSVRFPPRVVINSTTLDPVGVLRGALGSDNMQQIVELCDVELDMTGITSVELWDNRYLIASPGCERNLRSLGPRIFVRDGRGKAPLFNIVGDNVRIAGFRLEGPTKFIAQGDRKEKGIVISPTASAIPLRHIEISNMEIYYWSGLGIQVTDNSKPPPDGTAGERASETESGRGRLFNTNEGAVRIADSYFHHNRHGAGEGYGVDVTTGAYALIERNAFDENRHAIAGGSNNKGKNDYSGYTARDNLILAGGGRHCMERSGTGGIIGGITGGLIGGIVGGLVGGPVGVVIGIGAGAAAGAAGGAAIGGWCWWTHQIDMHGDGNTWPGDSNWQCGTAGETMIIQRNTILYTNGSAIKIRGNPADKAVVDGNVFKNSRSGSLLTGAHPFGTTPTIDQNGSCGSGDITKPIDVRASNAFGVDPTLQLASCNFGGGQQQDQFMTSGVTWWAKSAETGQWYYLNTMTEKLPGLRLGDFDGDGVCDAARKSDPLPRFYSKGGRTPWISVHSVIAEPPSG